jgi:hypothetical protein
MANVMFYPQLVKRPVNGNHIDGKVPEVTIVLKFVMIAMDWDGDAAIFLIMRLNSIEY